MLGVAGRIHERIGRRRRLCWLLRALDLGHASLHAGVFDPHRLVFGLDPASLFVDLASTPRRENLFLGRFFLGRRLRLRSLRGSLGLGKAPGFWIPSSSLRRRRLLLRLLCRWLDCVSEKVFLRFAYCLLDDVEVFVFLIFLVSHSCLLAAISLARALVRFAVPCVSPSRGDDVKVIRRTNQQLLIRTVEL